MIPNLTARLIKRHTLAMDEGKFDESKHPRADNGQFGKGSGGSSGPDLPKHAAQPVKPAQVSSTLTGVFTQAGFKKQKQPGPNGTVVYFHPQSTAKVIVHPAPEGKKWSSKWTHHSAEFGGTETPGEGSALAKLLGVAVQKAQAKQGATIAPATMAAIKAAPDLSLNALKNYEEAQGVLKDEGYEDAGVSDDGDYAFYNHIGEDDEPEIMAFNKKTLEGYFVDEYKAPTPTKAADPTDPLTPDQKSKANSSVDFFVEKGYKFAGPSGPTSAIYQKPDGAKIQMDYKTEDWVAITPGHLAKEGKGLEKLQALFNGKIEPGVKNSQQTVLTAAEKAAMTESQKKAVEAAKVAQTKASKHTALYTKLKGAAPQPSAPQQSAIAKYSGSAYSSWNDKLRHNPGYSDADTKALDAYLSEATFPEEVVVHRKVDGEYAKILKSIIFEGTKFIDRGYVSTSAADNKWSGNFRFEITCPKGSKGAAIGKWSHHPSEMEVLLPRGSAFIVTHYDPHTNLVKVTLDQAHLETKQKEAA